MRIGPDDPPQLVRTRADLDTREHHARDHDLAGSQIAELEELAQDLAGFAAQHPAFLAFLDDVLQLLGGVIPLRFDFLPAHTDQSQQPVSDRIQSDHDGQQRRLEGQDERRHIQNRVRRPLQRQRLRHHLSDHDMEIGQDRHRDDAGHRVRGDPAVVPRAARAVPQSIGEHVLAVHAKAEARH